jgi:hypothetical protein
MNIRTEAASEYWSQERLLPTFQAPEHLNVYDIRSATPEVQRTITMLTGLINRTQPRVYLIIREQDNFWLNEALVSVSHIVSPARGNDILDALLKTYRERIQGLIICNPNFIDSVNIAMMMAGQQDGIVVTPDQATQLQQGPHNLPVLADLRTYHWKNRLEAYHWAFRNLRQHASPRIIAGLNPAMTGSLQSFLVATRAFVYWLDARKSFPDFTQGLLSERCLMKRIFKSYAHGAVHLGWFISEPFGVRLTSQAGLPVLASDLFNNLEVMLSIPGTQNRQPPSLASAEITVSPPKPNTTLSNEQGNEPKTYVSFTMSDGDNIQYMQNRMLQLWRDPARGTIPLGWTISPLLMQAAPAIAAYYLRTASANDEFLVGPSGGGYMYPSRWPKELLPAFLTHTGRLMREMNLTLLEVLDAGLIQDLALANIELQRRFVEALVPFGLKGILSGSGLPRCRWKLLSGVPVYQNLGLADSADKTVKLIRNASRSSKFLNVYVFAYKMVPSDLKQVIQRLGNEYTVVTPGKLLSMITEGKD